MSPEQANVIRRWYAGGCYSYRRLAEVTGLTTGEVQAYVERGDLNAAPGDAVPEPESEPEREPGRRCLSPERKARNNAARRAAYARQKAERLRQEQETEARVALLQG